MIRGDTKERNAERLLDWARSQHPDDKDAQIWALAQRGAGLFSETSNGFGRHKGPPAEDYQRKAPKPPPILTRDGK